MKIIKFTYTRSPTLSNDASSIFSFNKLQHDASRLFIGFEVTIFFKANLPIVRSCTGWKRLSVNCSKRHDFPTPRSRRNDQSSQTQRTNDLENHIAINGVHFDLSNGFPLFRFYWRITPQRIKENISWYLTDLYLL